MHTLAEVRVQNLIRQTMRNEREQLLRAAYIETLRNRAKVKNYLAEQIMKGEINFSSDEVTGFSDRRGALIPLRLGVKAPTTVALGSGGRGWLTCPLLDFCASPG